MKACKPIIRAEPTDLLIDEQVYVVVCGLDANQDITLRAWVKGDRTDIFESFAYFTADDDGNVDLGKQPALGGSYKGIDPMGLFTSMTPSPKNERPYSRLSPRGVERPLNFHIELYNTHLIHEVVSENGMLTSIFIRRRYKALGVRREPVKDGRLRGTIFVPTGEGPFPAIVDLFGTAGGLMEFRASLLASHGYLTFSLAYFAHEDLPMTVMDLELEYFEEAKDFLKKHPAAAKSDVGVIGVSVGGTIAMSLASYVEGYKCAVVINGPSFSQYATLTYRGRSWPGKNYDMNRMYVENNGVVLGSCLDGVDVMDLGDSTIEFHKSKSSFLFIYCDDDKATNNEMMKNVLLHLLSQEKSCKYKIINYPGAGHLLEPPYSSHAPLTHTKLINLAQLWGGNTRQHAEAQLSSWREILNYFNKEFFGHTKL